MADTGRMDPFENMISLVAGPIAAVIRSFDQLRRGTEELLRGMENFNATMETLNETASRINRLLNDFEEPVRAMLPQLTRTVKMADELSTRLAAPVDQVAPGLARLAETLNSPIFNTLPRDLGQFMEIINDLGRRMSPLAQLAEQAGGMFGLRIPGLSPRAATPAPAPAPAAAPVRTPAPAASASSPLATTEPAATSPVRTSARARTSTAKKTATKRAPAKRSATKRTAAKKAPTRKKAAAKRASS